MLLASVVGCNIRVIDSIPEEVVVNTKTLFQQALTLCLVGTFGILGAACGSESDDCPSGEIRSGGECVPVDNDGGMDDAGQDSGNTCSEFETCRQNSCGEFDAQSQPLELANCLESNCETEINGCPNAAGLSCSSLNECLGNCGQNDDACRQQCQDNAGVVGVSRFNALISCQNDNNCEDRVCLLENCSDQLFGCFPDQVGDATCAESFKCQVEGNTCPGTVEAQIAQSEMLNCADQEGCLSEDEADPVSCLIASCESEAQTCGVTGDRSCSEVVACTQGGGNAADCILSFSSSTEAGNYNTLQNCVSTECTDATNIAELTTCASNNCGNARDTCGVNGTSQTCSDMWACASGEASDCQSSDASQVLFNTYIHEGSDQEQIAFFELNACISENCPDQEPSCIESSCSDEASTCGVSFSN
jgi:hypothetical protein